MTTSGTRTGPLPSSRNNPNPACDTVSDPSPSFPARLASATRVADYERDGVIVIPGFLTQDQVADIRSELARYIEHDLQSKPADAATMEADGRTVRNLWRLELHNPLMRQFAEAPWIREIVAPLVHGDPVLAGVETFNKPARIGSGVPYHQDNEIGRAHV